MHMKRSRFRKFSPKNRNKRTYLLSSLCKKSGDAVQSIENLRSDAHPDIDHTNRYKGKTPS